MVIVKRRELTLWERLFLPGIARAMTQTFKALFKPDVTRRYPEEPLPTTEATRGQPRLRLLEDGEHLACVSCGLCEAACPAYAITIDGQETEREIEREPELFEIDFLRCILCGFCEEACPEDAIFMSDELEFADFDRAALVWGIDKLKRPTSALRKRMDYFYKVNERWQKSSSTS